MQIQQRLLALLCALWLSAHRVACNPVDLHLCVTNSSSSQCATVEDSAADSLVKLNTGNFTVACQLSPSEDLNMSEGNVQLLKDGRQLCSAVVKPNGTTRCAYTIANVQDSGNYSCMMHRTVVTRTIRVYRDLIESDVDFACAVSVTRNSVHTYIYEISMKNAAAELGRMTGMNVTIANLSRLMQSYNKAIPAESLDALSEFNHRNRYSFTTDQKFFEHANFTVHTVATVQAIVTTRSFTRNIQFLPCFNAGKPDKLLLKPLLVHGAPALRAEWQDPPSARVHMGLPTRTMRYNVTVTQTDRQNGTDSDTNSSCSIYVTTEGSTMNTIVNSLCSHLKVECNRVYLHSNSTGITLENVSVCKKYTVSVSLAFGLSNNSSPYGAASVVSAVSQELADPRQLFGVGAYEHSYCKSSDCPKLLLHTALGECMLVDYLLVKKTIPDVHQNMQVFLLDKGNSIVQLSEGDESYSLEIQAFFGDTSHSNKAVINVRPHMKQPVQWLLVKVSSKPDELAPTVEYSWQMSQDARIGSTLRVGFLTAEEQSETRSYLTWKNVRVDSKTQRFTVRFPLTDFNFADADEVRKTLLSGKPREFGIALPDPLESDTEKASAGVIWSTCAYYLDSLNQRVTASNFTANIDADGWLNVTWKDAGCVTRKDKFDNAFTEEYVISYCVVSSIQQQNCSGMEQEITFPRLFNAIEYDKVLHLDVEAGEMIKVQLRHVGTTIVLVPGMQKSVRILATCSVCLTALVVLVILFVLWNKYRMSMIRKTARIRYYTDSTVRSSVSGSGSGSDASSTDVDFAFQVTVDPQQMHHALDYSKDDVFHDN